MTQSIATATPEEDRAMQTKYELALNKRIKELTREVKALELLTDAQQKDILEMQA